MSNKVVITGASGGIGFEFCRQYKEAGYSVVAACRSASSDLKGLGVQVVEGVDITRDKGVSLLAKELGDESIGLLINNAGVLRGDSISEISFDDMRMQFEVNCLGALRVTQKLVENMSKNSKIAIVTSRMGSIADNSSGGYYGYRASKAAVNAVAKSLAIDLRSRGIWVACLHPGYVKTNMTNYNGDIGPKESVAGMIKQIEKIDAARSGHFFHSNGVELPW